MKKDLNVNQNPQSESMQASDSSDAAARASNTVIKPRPVWARLFIFVMLTCLVVGGAAAYYAYYLYQHIEIYTIPARVDAYVLKKGANAQSASEDLLGDQVPGLILHFYLHEHPEYAAVQAGDYLINGHKTLPDLLKDMVEGKVIEKNYPTFTIVEGSTWPEILDKVKKIPNLDSKTEQLLKAPDKLHAQAMDKELLGWVGGSNANLEGLLLPATYPIYDNKPFGAVLTSAMREMAQFLKEHWKDKRSDINLSPYEILIVASIIERETRLDEERALVGAVIHNRLKKGIRLQVDPAVMYGVSPTFRGRLTRRMLQQDTPYNTYVHEGLPPTPIGMPSKSSILAALKPADSDVLFFVAKDVSPKSGHVFTSSLKEHNKAVEEYRQRVKNYVSNNGQNSTERDRTAEQRTETEIADDSGAISHQTTSKTDSRHKPGRNNP